MKIQGLVGVECSGDLTFDRMGLSSIITGREAELQLEVWVNG